MCVHQVSLADFAGVARASASRKPGAAAQKAAGSAKPTARAKVAEDPVLKAVSRVVDALADGLSFVPYRDSKITRLLEAPLGGGGAFAACVHAPCNTCAAPGPPSLRPVRSPRREASAMARDVESLSDGRSADLPTGV